jgi:hypothetical protein
VLSTHFHPYSPCFPSNSSSGARASLRRRRLFLGRLWLLRLLPVSAAAAPLKAVAIDVRCHSCTLLDVDAPATGGLLAPRTNTLLPPRFFTPTNQFAGRWHGNACGGLPPSLCYGHSVTLLQRLSPMRLPLQKRPSAAMRKAATRGWPCTLFAFCLPRQTAHGELAAHIAHAAQVAPMVPMQPMPVHKSVQILSSVDLHMHGQGLQAAFTSSPWSEWARKEGFKIEFGFDC